MKKKPGLESIGAFVGLSAPGYLVDAVQKAKNLAAGALMFYPGSPRIYRVVSKSNLDVSAFHAELKKSKILLKNVVLHASFLINLGNCDADGRIFKRSLKTLEDTAAIADFIGVKKIILHPGSFGKGNLQTSQRRCIVGIDTVLEKYPNAIICLETMSGSGSQFGKSLEELAFIINASRFSDRIGVCLDTCHIYAAGYNIVAEQDRFFEEIDRLIGAKKIFAVHINDSLGELGSNRDRHTNIGRGEIGIEALRRFVRNPRLAGLPMLLETPLCSGENIHAKEIALLRDNNLENDYKI